MIYILYQILYRVNYFEQKPPQQNVTERNVPKKPMSLRKQKKQKSRTDILAATEQLLAQRGFEATTMRDIAAVANISYQTLYNYFPTKALIVQALLNQEVAATTAQLQHLLNCQADSLLCKLRDGLGIRFAVVANQDRALWREVIVDTYRQKALSTELYHEIEAATRHWHLQLLQQAQATGELQPQANCKLLAHTLFVISEFAFTEFVLSDVRSEAEAMQSAIDQTELLVQPYLVA